MTMKRFLYAPDVHGQEVDQSAWRVVLDFAADFKPHRRILGGDVFEFAPFREGASEFEKSQEVQPDVEHGLNIINQFRATDWCLGNHDVRPWKMRDTAKTPEMRAYAGEVVRQMERTAERLKVRTYGYRVDLFCQIGPRLRAIHGFTNCISSARKTALSVGNCLAGHTHAIEHATVEHVDGAQCWITGCLRKIFAGFNERRFSTLRHRHGFAFGYYDETGPGFTVYQAQKQEDGKWVIPSGVKVYR